MVDIGAVTTVLTTNSGCLMHRSDHCSQNGRIFILLTHCIKFTKNHTSVNKFSSSIKMFFPNTYKTVCEQSIYSENKNIYLIFFNFVPVFMELPILFVKLKCDIPRPRDVRNVLEI